VTVKCPNCDTAQDGPESTQTLPSVVSIEGKEASSAVVSMFKCGCGHAFSTIEYVQHAPPRLSETWSTANIAQLQKAAQSDAEEEQEQESGHYWN
jgi:hypothetical protein